MLSSIEVVLISIGLLVACLMTIYLYSLRINSCVQKSPSEFKKKSESQKESSELNEKNVEAIEKSMKINEVNPQEVEISLEPEFKADLNECNEEDDIIALATLKGYKISGIRRRPESQIQNTKTDKPTSSNNFCSESFAVTKEDSTSFNSSSKSDLIVKSTESSSLLKSESLIPENNSETGKRLIETEDDSSWSHVPTREEEISKSLKNKLSVVQSELENYEIKFVEVSQNLERSQKRTSLLEVELNEQRKKFNTEKSGLATQLKTLTAHNLALNTKISKMESDISGTDSLKKSISCLQDEVQRFHSEKSQLLRELKEIKNENKILREQTSCIDSLKENLGNLERELEDKNKELALQTVNSKVELQAVRAKLESEVAFHRAEHANSVGSSTALHQEIAQLKSEIISLIGSDLELKAKIEELEELNRKNLTDFESKHKLFDDESKKEIELLKIQLSVAESSLKSVDVSHQYQDQDEIEEIKAKCLEYENIIKDSESKIENLSSEISILQSKLTSTDEELSGTKTNASCDESEVKNLKNLLAEAEIKISSLQSDLSREIKRADVSKKVYEAKLASLK